MNDLFFRTLILAVCSFGLNAAFCLSELKRPKFERSRTPFFNLLVSLGVIVLFASICCFQGVFDFK